MSHRLWHVQTLRCLLGRQGNHKDEEAEQISLLLQQCNNILLDVCSQNASSGDEDGCQGRQSTETLVSLIKFKRWSSFNLITLRVGGEGWLCVVPELFIKKTKGHRWSVPIQEVAAHETISSV